jgi:peptide-methionine (S)-S-oxide reductase
MRKFMLLSLLFAAWLSPAAIAKPSQTVTVAGGCYWCLEAIFQDVKGVEKVVSGFSGGHVASPSYDLVCTGTTGHAESIQITFDPKQIKLRELLDMFFAIHDPTTLNRQGEDEGTQYRSAIFYTSSEQKAVAEQAIAAAQKDNKKPIVTELTALKAFYPAENYHQNYYKSNPRKGYCSMVIAPKVRKFRKLYASKLKS